MPPNYRVPPKNETQTQAGYNYEADPQWRSKPLTPSQVLVHDIRLENLRPDRGPLLELNDRLTSSLVSESAANTPPASLAKAAAVASNPIEQQRFRTLEDEYGWLRNLRLEDYQVHEYDSDQSAKCRWIHCSSKFPEYLQGFLWALTDDYTDISLTLQTMSNAISRQTRFSKHGKYFAPFSQSLGSGDSPYPLLISVPFLDWSVLGQTPPLRFQVDRREGYSSTRSSAHPIRSVLQYFYRLEDTADRENAQVFSKHKPWSTNRELDLKIRQWYGHYPNCLNVDELWILVVDTEHIVTLSSNQTWKSRWPPLQLTSRISDISFRGIRNAFFSAGSKAEYTALTHAIACLSGSVGMMHRSFWPDIVLPAADRYAGYLSNLQYRLHRSASTKLVMELIACQEELNIVIHITQQQLDMINELQKMLKEVTGDTTEDEGKKEPSLNSYRPNSSPNSSHDPTILPPPPHRWATYRSISTSTLADPLSQLLDCLTREQTDLRDLLTNTDRLVTRTIQLVNIRLEDHGKAILIFTIVTIIFLPLNFVSSFFGMNVRDIRNLNQSQWLFWAVALCVTFAVVTISLFLAFEGGSIMEKVLMWRDRRKEEQLKTVTAVRRETLRDGEGEKGFKVLNIDRAESFGPQL